MAFGNDISLHCPRAEGGERDRLPDPQKWEPNEGGYTTKYYKKLTINGMKSVQYVWSQEDDSGKVYTAIQRNSESDPVVCEFATISDPKFTNGNYEQVINSLENYNQILSTFKFQ